MEPQASRPSPEELRRWADQLARQHFGVPFNGAVAWALRLRHQAGDFSPTRNLIRLSAPYYDRYGERQARATLLHELCHWWAWRTIGPHRENSRIFQELLQRTGAPRYAPPPPALLPRPLHRYRCPACGRIYTYRRRVSGYACGWCCRRYAGGHWDARFQLVEIERQLLPLGLDPPFTGRRKKEKAPVDHRPTHGHRRPKPSSGTKARHGSGEPVDDSPQADEEIPPKE